VAGVRYTDVRFPIPAAERRRQRAERYWAEEAPLRRVRHPGVQVIPGLAPDDYHATLRRCVVFLEFLTVAASNVVVECIARNTPLLVNRLPALEDYLGRDYPLFYDDIADAHRLLDPVALHRGHTCLAAMKKDGLRIETFLDRLRHASRRHGA
jgi:hypothetical protein